MTVLQHAQFDLCFTTFNSHTSLGNTYYYLYRSIQGDFCFKTDFSISGFSTCTVILFKQKNQYLLLQ